METIEQRIWKYQLKVTDWQNISMPQDAEILTVQVQNGIPCLWALVNPEAETEIRCIEIFGTGNQILSGMGASRKYISTFQIPEAGLVFHVFEYTGA